MANTKVLPKFDAKINNYINKNTQQTVTANLGVIIYYDPLQNTATVQMTARGSEGQGEVYANVPCPVNLGVQAVAPEQGRQCWVDFKNGMRGSPIVVNYLNTTSFGAYDYSRHNTAINSTPTFQAAL